MAARWIHLIITFLLSMSQALDMRWCQDPMGMQSGRIPDHALSASSAFDTPSVGPRHARLDIDRSGGAWCPKQQISRDVVEFLQIDFNRTVVISGIATQGRYGNGRGQEYAEAFRLEYWRPELGQWRRYRRWDASEVLQGNSDTITPVRHHLRPTIVADRLRVIPHGLYPRTVCMRLEIYGCPWNEEVASYSIPAGDVWSDGLTLDDEGYDGVAVAPPDGPDSNRTRRWSRGLGTLTDGLYGLDNFRISLGARKGHGWVGWNNHSMDGEPVELLFKFSSVRNLSTVHLHVNNFFSRHVQVFSRVRLRFSVGGLIYSPRTVNYVYVPDLALEAARNVTVRIPHVCARYVKLQLWFAAQWILVSEVTFESEPLSDHMGEITEESVGSEETIDGKDPATRLTSRRHGASSTHLNLFNAGQDASGSHGLFEAAVGAMSAIVLLLVLVVAGVVWTKHRRHKTLAETLKLGPSYDVPPAVPSPTPSARPRTPPPTANVDSFQQSPDPGYASLTRVRPNPIQHILINGGVGRCGSLRVCDAAGDVSGAVNGPRAASALNLNHYFPRVANTDPLSRRSFGRVPKPVAPPQVATGSWNVQPLNETWSRTSHNVPEIPRHSLRLVEWLGSSSVGEAYVCQVVEDGATTGLVDTGQTVVVRGGAMRSDGGFGAELRLLASLRHDHVWPLLASSVSDATGWMVFQFPQYGDLNTHLKRLVDPIDDAVMLDLSIQIGTGCQYLESQGVIHKDLATRNCLLSAEMCVKICDLAVVCSTFRDDYGEVRGRKPLPIRWLPWESLVLGKYGEHSAVWMLAVTVWEVATMGRRRPYAQLSDAQVILNADHFYYDDGKQLMPADDAINSPAALYQWMTSCWIRQEQLRPSLTQSVAFMRGLAYQSHTKPNSTFT